MSINEYKKTEMLISMIENFSKKKIFKFNHFQADYI